MPAKSKAQYRLMQAAKHDPKVRKRTGISKKTASDYVSKTPNAKKLVERKKPRASSRRMLGRY